MNKIIYFILFISSITLAQNSKLNVFESQEYQDQNKTDSIQSIYTSDSGNTGIVRRNKNKIYFDIFDAKLTRVLWKSIKMEKNETYFGDIFYNDEIKVFTETILDKTQKVTTCYLINLSTTSYKKIILSKTVIDKKLSLFRNKKGVEFAISPNQEYFSILTYTIHRDDVFFHAYLFNSNSFEPVFNKQFSRKENEFFSILNLNLDNDMNIFSLGKSYYNEGASSKKDLDTHSFVLDKISRDKEIYLSLDFDDKIITSVKPLMANDEYNLFGLFSEERFYKIKGVCNISISKINLEVRKKVFQDLPFQVYADLFGADDAKRKKKKELTDFKIDYILEDKDDNVYLLAEEWFYKDTNVFNGIGRKRSKKIYDGGADKSGDVKKIYDDILILKFNDNWEIEWGHSIYKRDIRPSYNCFIKNKELHVILNSGKVLKQLNDGRTKASKGFLEKSALYDFVYSETGDLSIDKIQNNDNKTYYLPNYGNFVEDRFIMTNDSKNFRKFMTLE